MPPFGENPGSTLSESNHSLQYNDREKSPRSKQSTPSSSADSYSTTKNALDRMEASVMAVMKFLAREGVSRASINELLRDFADAKYVVVLERAQQYAKCVSSEKAITTVLSLLQAAWESLSNYLALQYQQAHRHYHTLRRMGHHAHLTKNQISRALQHKIDLAEQCCASQKGLLLAQKWERRIKSLQ